MKPPQNHSDSPWEKLIHRAQADVGPPADLAALRRAVREASPATPSDRGWLGEFSAVFLAGRVVPTCLSMAGACALFATWEVWEVWETLPWAQLLASTTGGTP